MDRGYLDFARLYALSETAAFFLIRAKSNMKCRRVYSHPVDCSTGWICDPSVMLTGVYQAKDYPNKIRRVKYYDTETDKTFVFLTNNFSLPPLTIAQLYRCRWQVELFFKWIKQDLHIKSFYGTSENAVKTQIWIAISRVRARCHLEEGAPVACQSLHNFTGTQRLCFRKNTSISAIYKLQIQRRKCYNA